MRLERQCQHTIAGVGSPGVYPASGQEQNEDERYRNFQDSLHDDSVAIDSTSQPAILLGARHLGKCALES
jgi:hypothetical protein